MSCWVSCLVAAPLWSRRLECCGFGIHRLWFRCSQLSLSNGEADSKDNSCWILRSVLSHPSLEKSEGWGTLGLFVARSVGHPPSRVVSIRDIRFRRSTDLQFPEGSPHDQRLKTLSPNPKAERSSSLGKGEGDYAVIPVSNSV